LFAAAIFGTNFATVKMMDESLPPSVSASIRFTLAAVAISSAVLFRQKQQKMVEPLSESAVSSQTDSNEFTQACIRGAEVGAWYLVGYLCQSYGLQEVAASKVGNAMPIIQVRCMVII
jgi:drug/metabolite transporter (DMT)-like permease